MNKTTKELPLRYVERELQLISIDPLVMFDQKGIILDVNDAMSRVTGRSLDELIGTPFSDYFTDPERAYKGAMLTFETGEVREPLFHTTLRSTRIRPETWLVPLPLPAISPSTSVQSRK